MTRYRMLCLAVMAAWLVTGCSGSDSSTKDAVVNDVTTTDPGADLTQPDVPQTEDIAVQPDEGTPQDTLVEDIADEDASPSDVPSQDVTPDPGADPGLPCVGEFCAAGPDSAPNPRLMGPFPVGIKTVTYTDPDNPNPDGSPRVLKTEIWYPTTEEFRDGERYAYDPMSDGTDALREKYSDIDIGIFPCDGVWNPPVLRGNGRFPLVVFSHGAYGIRFQSVFYTLHLASHGYVVIAPDHQLNTLYEIMVDGWNGADLIPSAMQRPFDVLFLIEKFAQRNADPEDEFYDLLDMQNVGVTGHSFGGLTSFLVVKDPRVKAIVPMAPEGSMINAVATILDFPFIEDIHVPTMMMGGVLDKTLNYQGSMADVFPTLNPPKWFLTLNRGGHYTFTDMCRMKLEELADRWGDAEDAMNDGCNPETNWNYLDSHEATLHYAVAFFNLFLRNSPDSAAYLTAEAGADFGDEISFQAVPE